MSTLMRWIPVTEKMPPDSSKVFITDGSEISCAHWFAKFAPPHQDQPGEWVNQHERITGRWIDSPTHWMPVEDFQLWTRAQMPIEVPVYLKDLYDVEELDDVLDELTKANVSHYVLVGKKVVYHNEQVYTLVAHGKTIAIPIRVHCEYCNKRGSTLYFKSGLHNGAFCYAFNKRGKYLANFRDQVYVCKACLAKQEAAREARANAAVVVKEDAE